MTKMSIACIAQYFFGPAISSFLADSFRKAVPKSRPPTATIELHDRCVEWSVTARAVIHALLPHLVVLVAVPRVGSLFTENMELLRAQALLPLVVTNILGTVLLFAESGVAVRAAIGSLGLEESSKES